MGTSSVDATTYTGSGDLHSAALPCYTCSKFSETAKVDFNTFDGDTGLDLEGNCLESILAWESRSRMSHPSVISPADAQASEKLHPSAEIIRVSRTLPGTLGLWALAVDAAPDDASAVSEGLLATLIQEDESEERAARCDRDSLLERAMDHAAADTGHQFGGRAWVWGGSFFLLLSQTSNQFGNWFGLGKEGSSNPSPPSLSSPKPKLV